MITLGIIGIVATLTIPGLIANYQKNVVVTRMKKFYSAFNQALKLSEIDNGETNTWQWPTQYSMPENVVFYETYLKDYFKVTKYDTYSENKMPIHGVRLFLSDGSAVLIDRTWVIFYPVANKTGRMGKDVFSFSISNGRLTCEGSGASRNALLNDATYGCNNGSSYAQRRYCTAVIMADGWEIRDDYPW